MTGVMQMQKGKVGKRPGARPCAPAKVQPTSDGSEDAPPTKKVIKKGKRGTSKATSVRTYRAFPSHCFHAFDKDKGTCRTCRQIATHLRAVNLWKSGYPHAALAPVFGEVLDEQARTAFVTDCTQAKKKSRKIQPFTEITDGWKG